MRYHLVALSLASGIGFVGFDALLAHGEPLLASLIQANADLSEDDIESDGTDDDISRLQALGEAQVQQAQLLEAITTYKQVLTAYRQVGNRNGVAATLIRLADTYNLLFQYDDTLAAVNEALVIYQTLGDATGEATALDRLGMVQVNLGHPHQGLATLQQALELRRSLANVLGEAETLMYLGIALVGQGDTGVARENLQVALERHEETENDYYTALTLVYLGLTTLQVDVEQGLKLMEQGVTVAEKIDHRPTVAIAQSILGHVYQAQGQLAQATESFSAALVIAETAGNQSFLKNTQGQLAALLMTLGNQYSEQDQPQQAIDVYQQALSVIKQLGDALEPSVLGNVYRSLGHSYHQLGKRLYTEEKFEKALENYQQALTTAQQSVEIFRQNELSQEEGSSLIDIWLVYNSLIDTYDSLENYEMALIFVQERLEIAQQGAFLKTESGELLQARSQSLAANFYDYYGARLLGSTPDELRAVTLDELRAAIAVVKQGLRYAQTALDLVQANPTISEEMTSALRSLWQLSSSLQAKYARAAQITKENNPDAAIQDYQQALYWSQQAIDLETIVVSKIDSSNHPISEESRQSIRQGLLTSYMGLAGIYESQKAYKQALTNYNNARVLAEEVGDLERLKITLGAIWSFYSRKADDYREQQLYDEAIAAYRAGIQVAQERNNPREEQVMLASIANLHRRIGEYNKALSVTQEMLHLAQVNERPRDEFTVWNYIGHIHLDLGNYSEALNAYQRGLSINQKLNNQLNESASLLNLVNVYTALGDYQKALDAAQQSILLAMSAEYISEQFDLEFEYLPDYCLFDNLADYQQESCSQLEQNQTERSRTSYEEIKKVFASSAFNNLAAVYQNMGRYPEALENVLQALDLVKDITLRDKHSNLILMSSIHSDLGQPEQASAALQQAQKIIESSDERVAKINVLNNRALQILENENDAEQALTMLNQAFSLSQELGTRPQDIFILNNKGLFYTAQGDYPQAIETYQTALELAQEMQNAEGQVVSLDNLGSLYLVLGQTDQALAYRQQVLNLVRTNGSRGYESEFLTTAGKVHHYAGRLKQALDYYQQGLTLARELQFPKSELYALSELGRLYADQQDFANAERTLKEALGIADVIGSPFLKTSVLRNLGKAQVGRGDYEQAQATLETGLVLARKVKDKSREARLLAELGSLYNAQEQPETATIFLKQAVNLWEEIRAGLQVLPKDDQESFTETVADTYRQLADILLTQGRILEAQRVIELLKIEELREFTSQTRAAWTSNGIVLTPVEQRIQAAHGSLIAVGHALRKCKIEDCSDEEERELDLQRVELIKEYNRQTQAAVDIYKRCSTSVDDHTSLCVEPIDLGNQATKLLETHENAVLVYPLIVKDKLWLLWAGESGTAGRIEVNTVTPEHLAETVKDLRINIERGRQGYVDHNSLQTMQEQSEELYDWLIRPLEEELTKNNIKHLIFAHDRYTRYIPMAALHDGNNYLIENYAVSTVLSASLTQIDDALPPADQASVLGVGLSEPVAASETIPQPFSALENVPLELDGIIKEETNDDSGFYPGQIFLNDTFNEKLLSTKVDEHQVLHIATHGKFEFGQPDKSFILLGNGDPLYIPKIDTLLPDQLKDVHLVVLSACETAYGEEGSDGTEIAGISSYFLKDNRADAVMASLWVVDDASTSLLMQRFYEFLATGDLTKAEALQQAQLSLLYNQDVATRLDAVQRASIEVTTHEGLPVIANTSTAHPYHWAPFILIGNAL